MTLTEFILARIAEDEAEANDADGTPTPIGMWDDERVLAECAAIRTVVQLHPSTVVGLCETCSDLGGPYAFDGTDNLIEAPCPTLRALAKPYADHPDYREEWA